MRSEGTEVPPVPGLGRLAWMLFMQPIRLHALYHAWGLEKDPSFYTLWPRWRAGDPVVRALVGRYALLLFGVTPVLAFGGAFVLQGLGVDVKLAGVAVGVTAGVANGVAFAVANGVAFAVAYGVANGVAVGVAVGVAAGVVAGGAGGVTAGVAVGVAFGGALGVAGGGASGVAAGVARGVAAGVATSVAVGVLAGVAVAVLAGVAAGVAFGVAFGVAVGVAFLLFLFRLPTYPLEALTTLLLWSLSRQNPTRALSLIRYLPHRLHDLIYLPLPGLGPFLVSLGEAYPDLTTQLLAEAAASAGQKGVARRALMDLQTLTLQNAARKEDFSAVALLALPFLPSLNNLDPTSPIRPFQSAASDLQAGGESYTHRRRALESASTTLTDFITNTTLHPQQDPLASRLLPVAVLWRDITRNKLNTLADEEKKNPRVPSAFYAGLPLDPDRPEHQRLFKGRQDLSAIVNHHLDPSRQGVLVLVGQRRMGKSSFRSFLPRLLGSPALVLNINYQGLSGERARSIPYLPILEAVAKAFPQAPKPPDTTAWKESLQWLLDRDKELGEKRMLLLLDEVERVEDAIRAGECSTDFIDFLRTAGDELRNTRIVLFTAYRLPRLGRHWIDRLISATTKELSYLDKDSAIELLREPMEGFPDIYPEGGIERILEETRCQPFLLQKIGDELCGKLNAKKRLKATEEDLEDVLTQVARDDVFDELWNDEHRPVEERQALHTLAFAKAPVEATPVMRDLALDGYVEVDENDHATIAIPLFAKWIRRQKGKTWGKEAKG